MSPFELQNEILVLFFRSQGASRDACAVDQTLFDRPRAGRAIDIDPPIQIGSIEQRDKSRFFWRSDVFCGLPLIHDDTGKNNEHSYLFCCIEHDGKLLSRKKY